MELVYYSLRGDFKGILHFVPKSLIVVIETQLIPAEEALNLENITHVERYQRAARKTDTSSKHFGK